MKVHELRKILDSLPYDFEILLHDYEMHRVLDCTSIDILYEDKRILLGDK